MKPEVSIIIPVFNRFELLNETIASVLEQSHQEIEVLLIDDGSKKPLLNYVLSNFQDERIIVLERSGLPKGAATCRNIGLNYASGDFLIFLDSDDLLDSECVVNRLDFAKNHSTSDFYVFNTAGFKKKVGDFNLIWNHLYRPQEDLVRFLSGDTPWATLSVMWKKGSLLQIGGWNEDAICWQDWELHIRSILSDLTYEKTQKDQTDCYFRVDHDHESIGKGESLPKYLESRFKSLNELHALFQYSKDSKYNLYWLLAYFRIAAMADYLGEESLRDEVWATALHSIEGVKMWGYFWTKYLHFGFHRESSFGSFLKKCFDFLAYSFCPVHFWDTKNTFKKSFR
ncbi:MAG: glycosyltransferase involved in cell wall biosynthesis [Parvicella sp.]